MSDNPAGKDGIRRDIAKLKQEYARVKTGMEPHVARWKAVPWWNIPQKLHTMTNLYVESGRLSEEEPNYLMGHVHIVKDAIFIIIIIALLAVPAHAIDMPLYELLAEVAEHDKELADELGAHVDGINDAWRTTAEQYRAMLDRLQSEINECKKDLPE